MRALKFAMVTTFYPPENFGGDGIGVQRLSRALARRGHEVHVIHDVDAFRALGGEAGPAPEEPEGLVVHRLESRLGVFSPLLTHQTGRPVVHGGRIRRILDAGGFDVVHFHNVSLVGGPGVLPAGSGLKVYEAHEHWLVCPTHVLWRHDREPCAGRECLRCVLRYRRPPQYWRYTGLLEREIDHVDVFIAKSGFSRDKHREFGFPREMEVVPYFLPDDGAARSDADPGHGRPHDRPYFLFVGRLERIKGLDDVIPVFEEFDAADLLIAGDGTHGPALRALAGNNPRVRFLGRVPNEELAAYYDHALATIVPSAGYETFGIVLIEAFRRGVPVIARRIGPFPEIVETADGGLLFETPAELEAALDRFAGDPEFRRRAGERARRGFLENWTEEVVVERHLEVLERAMERRAARPAEAR